MALMTRLDSIIGKLTDMKDTCGVSRKQVLYWAMRIEAQSSQEAMFENLK